LKGAILLAEHKTSSKCRVLFHSIRLRCSCEYSGWHFYVVCRL